MYLVAGVKIVKRHPRIILTQEGTAQNEKIAYRICFTRT
jgi:hypothetical protein